MFFVGTTFFLPLATPLQIGKLQYCKFIFFAGIPLVYELDENLKPLNHYYLATEEEVKAAEAKVAAQGKAK